jgi:acyl transferase domain-containing protein
MSETHPQRGTEIAIIGMVGRFPGAPDLETFWRNLRGGVESTTAFTVEELRAAGIEEAVLAHPRYVRTRGVVAGAELFDAAFFGYSPREAEIMDPQHRVFLECAWEALENAGYASEREAGRVGVFGSVGLNTYLLNNLLTRRDVLRAVGGYRAAIGSDKDYLTTRVSYKLDLSGPSLSVQTACSSSLVAIHLACQSLLGFECDAALAGGVSINVPQRAGYWCEEGGIASPDGHCRAFDAGAQGTVFGDGVGILVLKRAAEALADGDRVLALIKGSAINNDGGARIGYTAPGVRGQARVIAEALAVAGVEPETISYVEAHGTGTALGDPIEMAALTEVFAPRAAKGSCAVGSLKTNVGHLSEAAGVAGVIKTVLALQHGELPASLHFRAPNPQLDLANGPFRVNAELAPWPGGNGPRRAGVSSFGIGGTNAHLVLEEAPAAAEPSGRRPWQLLLLSAKTETALDAACDRLAGHLRRNPELDLADVAHTLRVGRRTFAHRRALVVGDPAGQVAGAISALEGRDPHRVASGAGAPEGGTPVAFVFPGQGTQRAGMASELYRHEAVFRDEVERCAALLAPLGFDLRVALLGVLEEGNEAADLDRTEITQPALFVTEYALARLWMSWGVQPAAMLGHSLGELVAACLAGVLSLADALRVVVARGRLLQRLPAGAMLALRCGAEEARPHLRPGLSLAASNGPRACTVSGPPLEIAALEGRLLAADVPHRRLRVSRAFHSAMVDAVTAEFAAVLRTVRLEPPRIPFLSNVTGTWITGEEATDPAYWARHLRETVRFGDGVAELLRRPELVLLEVGPGDALTRLARQQQPAAEPPRAWSCLGGDEPAALPSVLAALGALWTAGVTPDWGAFAAAERRLRVALPTYPFERRRHWIDPLPAAPGEAEAAPRSSASDAAPEPVADIPPALEEPGAPAGLQEPESDGILERLAEIWQELLGVPRVRPEDDFFKLGGDSLLGTQLLTRLQESFPVQIPLRRVFEEPTLGRLAALVREELVNKLEAMSELEAEQLV